MAEWKLWSEEKPKEETHILVTRDFNNRYHKNRHVEPGVVFNGEFLSDWSEYQIYSDAYSEPIAWMPFPKPYQLAKGGVTIEYTSNNGYKGVLYGERSFAIYEVESGKCKLHTGFRNINTYDELVKQVEDFPRFSKWLEKATDDLYKREGVEDEEDI